MDLVMYTELFRRYWLAFFGVIVVAIAGTLLLVLREPTSYEGSVLLTVMQRAQQSSSPVAVPSMALFTVQ